MTFFPFTFNILVTYLLICCKMCQKASKPRLKTESVMPRMKTQLESLFLLPLVLGLLWYSLPETSAHKRVLGVSVSPFSLRLLEPRTAVFSNQDIWTPFSLPSDYYALKNQEWIKRKSASPCSCMIQDLSYPSQDTHRCHLQSGFWCRPAETAKARCIKCLLDQCL